MAVDTNFGSLFENLKLEDLWLRPRPWESVPSESGLSRLNSLSSHPSLCRRLYDTSNVSEASLVRLVMNALQGVESALVSIEKLSAAFCSSPADRTFHRIPSLWNRSLSTLALGNILKAIGRSGCVVFLLLKFVDHFTNLNLDGNSRGNRQVSSEPEENRNDPDREGGEHPSYSLVNQAFAIAVGKALEGYISALDTLYASVSLRRLSKTGNVSSCSSFGVGCLTSIDQSEVTLLEVYLHTKGLRTQIEALGNICHVHDVAPCFSLSTFEDLSIKAKFSKFPRGGDLLSYLYTQLKVSDPVHCGLLKFLFLRSCEPYCNFIRSWIYKAKVSDPYNEFIVDHVDNLLPYSVGNTGISIDFPSATIRERDGVAIPCFLKDLLIPLFRAGQQLQVLMKLLELSDNVGTWNRTYEDLLPYWGGLSSNSISHASPLTFNKGGIETMIRARNIYYKRMMEKLENLLINLDFRYQQVVPHGFLPVFVNNRGRSLNMTTSFAMDDRLISPETDKKDQNSPKVSVNSEASSITDEFSYLEDPLESDECASLNSSEEQNQSEQLLELPYDMVGLEQKYVSALIFSSSISTDNSLQKPSKSDMSCAVESDSCEILEKMDRQDYFVHRHYSGTNLNDNSLPLELGDPNLSLMSETQDPDNQQDMGWLPRGLHKNNFYADRGNKDYTWLHISGCGLKVSNRNSGVLEEGTSYCNNLNISKNDLVDEATKKYQCPSETFASSNLFSSNTWKVKYHYNFLSKNPMLTNTSFVHLKSKTGESCSSEYREHQSSFDFTSVKDPFMVCVERLAASPRHQFATELSILTDSAASAAFDMSGSHDSKSYNCEKVSVDKTKSSHMYSPLGSMANHRENVLLTNVSGGSGWESLLGNSGNTANITARDHKTRLAAILEIPLDFVIEKCLLEEILLQYKYVSKLTIKLLEEGFNLQEHFLALRRYHFMELADWADLFIMSLWRHKWYIKEADSRISEIQGFLELSVQRSSCERDDNKDRLYVYMKKNSMMPLSASATGIHSFDFLGLGYRVDWPLSIVLTPTALKVYAEIFSFLIQVKLAISSLAEAWCSLKELIHVSNRTRHPELHKSEVSHLSILMKLRQRVNHFVATLQQYVQSQLSHVSWFQFLHSLKHQVKDMMDLESVHMAYLTDSLHICFLSDETRLIASIIQSILQCALDFRSCVSGSTWETELDGGSHSKLSRINISQVLTIKGAFDKNIKELYLCYLKSPRHGEFGLSGFWDYLNYNEYYSEIIGKEMGHRTLYV